MNRPFLQGHGEVVVWAPQVVLVVRNPPARAGDTRGRLDPRAGKVPWGGHGDPLQCHCLEGPLDRSLAGCSPRGHTGSGTTEVT